jgi:dienelactone hydrolase
LGYVAVIPDSFAPRRLHTTCGSIDVKPGKRALDALGALVYLRGRPDVIPRSVAVMGWSEGGAGALAAVTAGLVRKVHPKGGPYRAAIGVYPGCNAWKAERVTSPLLMLIGGDDDWARPGPCVERAKALQAGGAVVEWKIYPGAMHAFDEPGPDRIVQTPGGGMPHHLRYDAVAASDAHAQVQRFLAARLH